MTNLSPFALNDGAGNVVPGSLVLSQQLPSPGNWFLVAEGVQKAFPTNPETYDRTVRNTYASAVSAERFGTSAKNFIFQKYGYQPSNIVLSNSICSDDVDGPVYVDINNIGQNPASVNQFLGAFMSGGLSGYPHTGVLGLQAWGSHATTTTNGALFLINTPHIGISQDGTVGRIIRRGKASNAADNTCGAVATAIAWVAANASAPVASNFPNDYQNYVLCNILFSFKAALAAIPAYGDKMVFATEKIRLAADTFLTGASGIITPNVPANTDVFYCSGIFINTDDQYNAYISVTSFKKYNSVGGWVDLTSTFLNNL
jgi:hypothetical protein